MREYETIYILRPELGGEAVDAFNAKMKDIVGSFNGKVIRLSNWGKKKLAYRVKKCNRGTYAHLLYLGEGKTVDELERNLRLSDSVIRHLTVLINGDVDPATRQAEADVKLRGDAEDDGGPAPAPAPARPESVQSAAMEAGADGLDGDEDADKQE